MVKQRINLKDVAIYVNGEVVGGAESLSVTIERDNEYAYEGGSYYPVEIVQGKLGISGSVSRAYIDNDMVNRLCPNQALWPEFTITAAVVSGKTPTRNMVIFGAVMDSIALTNEMDGYAKTEFPFKALNWRFD